MSLYFDNAAACPVPGEYLTRFMELSKRYPGNQESMGSFELRNHLERANRNFLKSFCTARYCEDYEVFWCASGTDAVRIALFAIETVCPQGDILYTDGEHASVLAALKCLPSSYRIVRVKLLSDGRVDPIDLEQKLGERTRCLCLHWVQSETGCIQNLAAVRKLMLEKAPAALLCSDAIQGAGKMLFPFSETTPDFALLSGQKFGLPYGGALVYRKSIKLQLVRFRSELHQAGRLPLPFILLFSEVFTERMMHCADWYIRMKHLRDFLLKELCERLPNNCLRKTIPDENASPWILHLLLASEKQAFQGAIIVRALSGKGILIASGSACNAESDTPSFVLRAMGISERDAWAGIRISLFDHNTESDCRKLANALREVIYNY